MLQTVFCFIFGIMRHIKLSAIISSKAVNIFQTAPKRPLTEGVKCETHRAVSDFRYPVYGTVVEIFYLLFHWPELI